MSTQTLPVLAQYLTVAEATVDITDESHHGWLNLQCHGCTWTDRRNTGGLRTDTTEQTAQRITATLPIVRDLAQTHAEKCRAIQLPVIDR